MLKIFAKNSPLLDKEISLKQLPVWVTALKRNYHTNVFFRTWWNIVTFHTFFVLVMVIVFAFILYHTKTNLFQTVSSLLQTLAQGGTVDSNLITQTSQELDQINFMILIGMVIFSAITGILAAHITLIPTRDEFLQRKKFITAIAHELRTPLAVLRTSNEVALYDLDDREEVQKVITGNIEETKHIANILNNLVIFSRVGTSESLHFEPTDVSALLLTVTKKLEPLSLKHKVVILYTPSELPLITANPTGLEQIFYNILKNAINYSKKDGGTVTVASFANASYVVVTITDTGIGMAKKNLHHIFEPFFRVNPDDSQSVGSGLGLALVFEIMKLHKGIVTVESTQGLGTTFTLQFPLSSLSLIQEQVEHSETSVSFSFEK